MLQAQQKDVDSYNTAPSDQQLDEDRHNINWYSDDDDDDEGKLMIKDEIEDSKPEESPDHSAILPAPVIDPGRTKPVDVIQKLGDLSKINIPLDVSKLLSSITQTSRATTPPKEVRKNTAKNEKEQRTIVAVGF